MSYIYINDKYMSQWSVETLVEAIEASDLARAMYEEGKDVPYKHRSEEFNRRLERAEMHAEAACERAIYLLGDFLLETIQEGIKEHMNSPIKQAEEAK